MPNQSTVAAIYGRHTSPGPLSPTLPASLAGASCRRFAWLGFRWAWRPITEPQKIMALACSERETRALADSLRAIEVELHTLGPDGKPISNTELAGHLSGTLDGMGVGFPEDPKRWHVLEVSAVSDKRFQQLKEKGSDAFTAQWLSKIQILMKMSGVTRALYLVSNKNDAHLFCAVVEYDEGAANAALAAAHAIVSSSAAPARIADNPDFFECKMCPARPQCWSGKRLEVNCRTCIHATPELDGEARWSCAHHKRDLTIAEQRQGCGDHRIIPDLIVWATPIDGNVEENWVEYQTAAGTKFFNKKGDYSSFDLAVGEELAAVLDGLKNSLNEDVPF